MFIKRILLVAAGWSVAVGLFAQLNNNCPGCIINSAAFGASPAASAVGLFPDSIVIRQDDTVNIDVTYMMPTQLQVSGVTATVTEVQILGIDGTAPLPSGLSITCDQMATSCAYYPQTYRFGCVKLCGRTTQAATAGFVPAKIVVAGTGSALGTTQTQDQDITVYYMILPDTTACHTVCFQNKISTGCDSATLGVYAGIDITCPDPVLNPCSYSWNYGNGQTGTSLSNTSETYSSPGTYPVSLTAITKEYVITQVTYSVPGDPLTLGFLPCATGCAWYNNICNGDGINPGANSFSVNIVCGSSNISVGGSSSTVDTIRNVNDTLSSQALAITVTDACLLTNLSTATTTLTVTGPGTYTYSIGSGPDATGTITVALVTKDSITYTDSVHIYSLPDTPVIVSSADSICQGDSVYLSIGGAYPGYTIQWFQDSTFLSAMTGDTTIVVYNSGNYHVTVINPATHCQASSQLKPVAVSGVVPTGSTPVHYASEVYLNPFITDWSAVWYFDSTLVSGQTGISIPYLGAGTYYAYVYPTGFLQCGVYSQLLTTPPTGIAENGPADVYNLSVYPNPTKSSVTVKVNVLSQGSVTLKLHDVIGREVYNNVLSNTNGQIADHIDLSAFAKGVYTLEVSTAKGSAAKKVVVE